jgi:hypothetical protein
MRRALLVAAVAVVAAGASLIYIGTRAKSHSQVEHLPRFSTTTASSVPLPEGTWTFGSGPAGFAVGRMHIKGGPRRPDGTTGDSPIAGTIAVHHAGDATVLEKVTVGPTGQFRIDLPGGDYQLTGRSPNVGNEEIDSRRFTISTGQTTPVDLVVIAT